MGAKWAIAVCGTVLGALAIGLGPLPVAARGAHCQADPAEVARTAELRAAALTGGESARQAYRDRLQQQSEELARCRQRTWPPNQAIWLRLYPCDIRDGSIAAIFDDIVAQGYNEVYVEVFFDGQVLLPAADNRTPWPSVVRVPGAENKDLLAEALAAGRERNLKTYAWLFSLNFGYSYAQLGDRQEALARNGAGQNTLDFLPGAGQVFVDPYSPQARRDYARLLQAVLQRQPDGVLFDYIRYPRGTGGASVADTVDDLWIYSPASQTVLRQRANQKGQVLLDRFLSRGYLTSNDLSTAASLGGGSPNWQGRPPNSSTLQRDLWNLTVAHAAQGVIDFLTAAAQPVRQRGLPAGAVFFPDGNQVVGDGAYDSRLQPWSQFPRELEWHAMSYGVCGNTSCITDLVRRVVERAPAGVRVAPALAGQWGRAVDNRPPLEAQMADIRRNFPRIDTVSHFSYSWLTPEQVRDRKFCDL